MSFDIFAYVVHVLIFLVSSILLPKYVKGSLPYLEGKPPVTDDPNDIEGAGNVMGMVMLSMSTLWSLIMVLFFNYEWFLK